MRRRPPRGCRRERIGRSPCKDEPSAARVLDLAALVGDPNVTIHEAKVFVCRVSKDGRTPRA